MIKTHSEYQNALQRLEKDREVIEAEEKAYRDRDLDADQMQRLMEPHLSFHEQLKEEVAWYESVRSGAFNCIQSLEDVGKLLIAARIRLRLSQRDFADKIGISEAQVSRDEKNEYYGITTRRAAEILDKLGAHYSVTMEPLDPERDLQPIELSATPV